MTYKLPSPEAKPPKLNPENFHHLIPLAEKYGISEDFYRDEMIVSLNESKE